MTAPPRTRRNSGERTRARLVSCAETLAGEMEIPKITVRHVSERAEVSRATFYLYFENIPAVYLELARETCAALYRAAGGSWSGPDARGSIDAATRGYVATFREHAAVMRVLYSMGRVDPRFAELLAEARLAFLERIERSIRLGIAAGTFRPVDPVLAGDALGGMVDSLCWRELESGRAGTLEHVSATLTDLWFHAIAIRPNRDNQTVDRKLSSTG